MERGAWTDQRLSDRFDYVDDQLAEVRKDIRELRGETTGMETGLRGEMRSLGEELRGEMRSLGEELRGEMRSLGEELRGEIAELRSTMYRLHITTLVVMVALFSAIFARGG